MITVSKGRLKAKMLEYFRKVQKTGEDLIVTDNHKPVLRIVTYSQGQKVNDLFADIRGKVKFNSPVNEPTHEEWSET